MSKISELYSEYGQSIWLDYIDRNLLYHGGLKELVAEGVRGVTSNPTIFHKAITTSTDYDDTIRDLMQADHEIDVHNIYQWLTIQDVQMAADILEPVYTASGQKDGFVSLEVSPHLAFDTAATLKEAHHLWRAVDRPNLMIKVPATEPGLPAFEQLIAEGINVNVTLLFSIDRYKAVSDAYIRGLSQNPHPEKVSSVASFFVSRVDTLVDTALEKSAKPEAQKLKGRIAIANAKIAYRYFRESMDSPLFAAQRKRGARVQRPLWASTGTKNPAYSDVLYVEQLIGSDTINTLPPATLDAFQAHGELRHSLESEVEAAENELEMLTKCGVDLAKITQELEMDGVKKFIDSYDQLLLALKEKLNAVGKSYASQ